jgi:hypothetical protein
MADAKPQRCRLTTQQQHTQQPVPTPPRLKSVTIHDAPSCYPEPRVISPEAEYYTEAPKYYNRNTTRLCMLPLPTTPRPRITTTPKRSSTTLQPTLPRATTPTYQRITVRKRSR